MTSLKTNLYDEHVKLGAKLAPFAGWDMPIQYSSVKEEVLAVRQNVGVFDVGHMGEFFVEGDDAEDFVDYLLPNDVKNAPVGKAVYAPLCREDGTVIDDLIVYKLAPGRILICVNASNTAKDFAWIKEKHDGYKCQLTDQTQDFSLIAIQGPKSFEVLSGLVAELPNIEYYSVAETSFEGLPIIVARTGYTGEDGFEVFGGHDSILSLWTKLIAHGVTPCGLAARDVLRLEVGYPLYGHELNDSLTPYDAGLGWTIKGQKENFIGKDALASKPSTVKTIKLILEKGIPREGYPVLNSANEVIGKITSGTMSVVLNKGIAIAQIDKSKMPSDEIFQVDIRQKNYPAQYTKTAFVTGGHK